MPVLSGLWPLLLPGISPHCSKEFLGAARSSQPASRPLSHLLAHSRKHLSSAAMCQRWELVLWISPAHENPTLELISFPEGVRIKCWSTPFPRRKGSGWDRSCLLFKKVSSLTVNVNACRKCGKMPKGRMLKSL